jgi:hypothetical protein
LFALRPGPRHHGTVPVRQFLHRLSVRSGSAEFLPTTRELVRTQAFLDGRTGFATGPLVHTRAAEFVRGANREPHLRRYIFHVSFCGSTFLSRLLDAPGRALVLREPNCLADLANQRSADPALPSSDDWRDAVAAVQRHLAEPWTANEPVVVKPSNWANSLLPDICADPARIRPVFIHMPRQAFVEAVIRGGPERIAYTARSAVHLSNASRADAELVAQALARQTDERGKVAALSIVAHAIQLRLFEQACKTGGWGEASWLAFEELTRDPLRSARKAAAALEITIPCDELVASIRRWSGVPAKQPEQAFASRQPVEEPRARDLDREIVNSALAWADTAIGR